MRTWYNSLPKKSQGKSGFKGKNRYHYEMFVLRLIRCYAVVLDVFTLTMMLLDLVQFVMSVYHEKK